MKAIVLARVSSREQAEGESIEAQTRKLLEYAQLKVFEISKVYKIIESSTKDTRKQFDSIITSIRKHRGKVAILIETVDRIQRDFSTSVVLDELRKKGQIEIHFIREHLVINQMSNSADILRWDMAVMFAKSYVLQLSDNVKRSFDHMIKQGRWIGQAPIGYLNTIDEFGNKTIVPDPERFEFIQEIFRLYSTGNYSMRTLARQIEKEGLTNKTGNSIHIKCATVEFILKNPFYAGNMRIKGQIYPHKYKPIISYDLFMKCQRVRESYKKIKNTKGGRMFVLKGFAKCAKCGGTITVEIKKGKHIYYHCNNYRNRCEIIYAKEDILLEPILSILSNLRIPPELSKQIKSDMKSLSESKTEYHKTALADLRQSYDHIQAQKDRLLDLLLDDHITKSVYSKKVLDLTSKQEAISESIREHEEADFNFFKTASTLIDVCNSLNDAFVKGDIHEKREIIKLVFKLPLTVNAKNMVNPEMRGVFKTIYELNLPEIEKKDGAGNRTLTRPNRKNIMSISVINPGFRVEIEKIFITI